MQDPSISKTEPGNEAMPTSAQILDWLVIQFGEVTGEGPASIDVDGPLTELGLGSVQLIGLVVVLRWPHRLVALPGERPQIVVKLIGPCRRAGLRSGG